jgi:hypothetical protein
MHQISIYCPPPPSPNPFHETCMQGLVHFSQTPSPNLFPPVAFRPGQSEQTAAAQAFGPCAPPLTTSAPSTPPQLRVHLPRNERDHRRTHLLPPTRKQLPHLLTLMQSSQSGTNLSLSPRSEVNPESGAPASAAKCKKKKTDQL